MFKGKNRILIVAISLIIGCALGMLIGSFLNEQAWGIIIGSAIGSIIGIIIYANSKKRD